jgi:regulator of RNase E activity RraA
MTADPLTSLTSLTGAGAFLGDVNGSLLAALGVRGVVTNGRVRDVGELRGLPYPVFATGPCVARAYMRSEDALSGSGAGSGAGTAGRRRR